MKAIILIGWTAISMAKGRHPLKEIIAIDLVVLLNATEAETTNHFFYSRAACTSF